MKPTRILLASTALSLFSLGISNAAPLSQIRSVGPMEATTAVYPLAVQLSIEDAEAALADAEARLAETQASGGDVAAAQADVDAAAANLAAARAAVDADAAASTEAQTPQDQPAAAENAGEPAATESTQQDGAAAATEAEVGAAVEGEAGATTGPDAGAAAEAETGAETAPPPETPAESPQTPAEPEAQTGEQAEPAQDPAAEQQGEQAETEEPAAEQPAADDAGDASAETPSAPETESAVEQPTDQAQETQTPEASADGEEAAPADTDGTAAEAEPAADQTPAPEMQDGSDQADAPTEEPASDQPAESEAAEDAPDAAGSPEPDAATETEAETDAEGTTEAEAETGAADGASEEVLTLPVEDGAPVLDSAKEELPPVEGETDQAAPAAAAAPQAPPPASDEEAQAPAAADEPAPQALAESGERLESPPEQNIQTNVTIVNKYDNRTILQVDNRTVIDHDERDRLRAGSNEVYYERLRGGRVREVIVRPNGVQLVTITNRWGDVIQRSRIMPDGREYVLFYARANSDGSRHAFVDPGRRLPPLRLSIPISDYILDSTEADPSAFLEFLMEPPVEQVERLYSVEEVRRSARIRDKVRRIDMDSLTFEFGKATIAEDQIQRLSDVAGAMSRILDRNPAETFLIEGHTDAVGTDEANLLLSDRRAETIAVALTDVFGIPPENLVTQGYGERYLKVRTEAPERLNRRVTIRRITPLVTPIASR